MKKLYLLAFVALFSVTGFSQWQLKLTPLTGIVYGIDFVSSSVIWISTDNGDVGLSKDGGNTWVKAGTPAQGAYSVAGLTDKIAVVVTGPDAGDGAIFRTTDAGTTWTKVYTKSGAWFNFVDNIDANTLWAQSDPVGGKFLIVKSTDGGATWAEAANSPAPSSGVTGLNDCFYRIGNTAWFGTGGAANVYKSATAPDGPWTPGITTSKSVGSVAFSSTTGKGLCAMYSYGVINKSTDGGVTWSVSPARPDSVMGMDYLPNSSWVWVSTTTGLFRSSNDGATWTKDTIPVGVNGVASVKFFGDANIGIAGTGSGVVMKSTNSAVLPVELTSFTAVQKGSVISLNWETATEINNKGFDVERKIDNGKYSVIGFKNGFGTSASTHSYSFTDDISKLNATTVAYRIKQIDFDGRFEYSKEVNVSYSAPVDFNLAQNYPNPFNPSTTISYALPKDNFVSLKVYNVLGQLVSTLVNEVKTAGVHNVTFDASKINSGVYYGVLKVGNSSEMMKTIKMSLIK
jgi:photosystem II stability/assembly factor-like uncharacterized protein